MASIPLLRYVQHTVPGSSHHNAFWNALDEALSPDLKKRLAPGGDLRGIWEAQPAEAAQPPPAKPADRLTLSVPYEYQLNNGPTGYRECFSSTCSMVARYWRPKLISSDTEYNKLRARYGDTTDASAQLRALEALGLKASFKQNGTAAVLERLIRAGQPVPVGWLHRGTMSRPSGGGHWTCVIGFDPQSFVHHDPNGDPDLVGGGYLSHTPSAGKAIRMSRKNWLPRWEVEGCGSGWYMDVKG